jgi:hypothetical protein
MRLDKTKHSMIEWGVNMNLDRIIKIVEYWNNDESNVKHYGTVTEKDIIEALESHHKKDMGFLNTRLDDTGYVTPRGGYDVICCREDKLMNYTWYMFFEDLVDQGIIKQLYERYFIRSEKFDKHCEKVRELSYLFWKVTGEQYTDKECWYSSEKFIIHYTKEKIEEIIKNIQTKLNEMAN